MNAPEKHEIVTAPAHEVAAPAGSPMGMMLTAMKQGASLEQISQMMDLQDRWQKAEAKKLYDAAFAAFKAEGVRIIKGRTVTDGPLRGKSYAELHDVVNAVTEALSKHGLSSWWRLTTDDRDWIEVTCYLRHVGGHEESVSMGGPPDTGGAKNAIQARASAKTYLERYTLKAILGLSEEMDDNDGSGGDGRENGGRQTSRPELKPYPKADFDKNLAKWLALINSGKKTADDIIRTVSSKAILSDEQKAVIRGDYKKGDDGIEDVAFTEEVSGEQE